MQHWFVYYKLDEAAAFDVEPRVRDLQKAVHAATGVRTRLMRRADRDSAMTLLEVYEGVSAPATFERELSVAVARAGLPARLIAQRRTERFEER